MTLSGDEGNVASHWEETALRSELDRAIGYFDKWCDDFDDEMPNSEFRDTVASVEELLDALQEMLTGKI